MKVHRVEAFGIDCDIVSVCKRRDGGTRYWCLAHKADATAKYGKRAKACRYSHIPPVSSDESLEVKINDYPGGLAMWGAVPPVYDTTTLPLDKGIHVHARRQRDGDKDIDQTYRRVSVSGERNSVIISELDAIYFMASSIFGFQVREVHCVRCGYSHLDKDWFSVHPHQSHLCAGCGRNFRDSEIGIGNPIAGLRAMPGSHSSPAIKARQSADIYQKDYPGGIQIWGSNEAFLWTSKRVPESGIHLHAFGNDLVKPLIDDTFSSLTIDGFKINARQVQLLMAQRALPHLEGRVRFLQCQNCGKQPLDNDSDAFTPRTGRSCKKCRATINLGGGFRRIVTNPILFTLGELEKKAVRGQNVQDLGLIPETL